MRVFRASLIALTLSAAACGTDAAGPPVDSGDTGVEVSEPTAPGTYHGEVRTLIDVHCLGCHTDEGIGSFSLDDPAAVEQWSAAIVDAVSNRRMPPWLPSPNGLEILRARRLSDTTVATFEAWAANDYAMGDPADYVPVVDNAPDLREPDILLEPEVPYVADPDLPDDYRCLSFPMVFEEEAFVTGYDVIPGAPEIVHHVILYLVPKGDIAQMEALDAADEGPGYTCYGGSLVGQDQMIAGWVPGANPEQFPDGMAMRIPVGARLVMQVHYNTLQTTGELPADSTRIALWTSDEEPAELIVVVPFLDSRLDIDAGNPRVVEGQSHAIPFGADIIGVVPHMHTLGTEIRGFLTTDTVTDLQIIDIPEWDFNWQQFYWFDSADVISVTGGDRFRIECIFDNSAANQAIVNGEQLEPRDVSWGAGTLDEMCLLFLLASVPSHPSSGGLCGGFEPCVQSCDPGDPTCFMTCSFAGGLDCVSCVFGGMEGCVVDHCLDEARPFVQCDGSCREAFGCNTSTCSAEFSTLLECIVPLMEAGECNDGLSECEVSF